MCTIGSGENCAGPLYSLYSSSVSKDWEAHPVNKSVPHNEKSRPIFFIDNASAPGVWEDCAQTHHAPSRPFWPERCPLVSEAEEQDHWNKPPAKTRKRIEAQISSGRAYAHSRLIATTDRSVAGQRGLRPGPLCNRGGHKIWFVVPQRQQVHDFQFGSI